MGTAAGEGSGQWRAGEPGQPLVLVSLSSTVMPDL
jgi:hypothetical protein